MPFSFIIDWKKLTTAGAKTAVDFAVGNYPAAIKSAVDIAGALGWEGAQPPNAGEGAKLLVERALLRALLATFRQHMADAAPLTTTADAKEMEARLVDVAAEAPLTLDLDAFDDPGSWPVVDATVSVLETWLNICGVREDARQPMIRTLRAEVPIAIRAELRDASHAGDYEALLRELRPRPGDEAAKREWQWRSYRAKLIEEPRKPMFRLDEEALPAVSLADMYMPARAQCRATESDASSYPGYQQEERPVRYKLVWLDKELRQWLDCLDPDDSVRIVLGEPGVGKSSFVKIFAAQLARDKRRILVVPMGSLNYKDNALGAVRKWIAHKDELGFDPLDERTLDLSEPLLLILDGLDEMAHAGKAAAEVVGSFCEDLIKALAELNHGKPRVFLLLCGRPGAAEVTRLKLRSDHAWLKILRYAFNPKDIEVTWGYDRENRELEDSGLRADQRPEWWYRYGRYSGRNRAHVPGLVDDKNRWLFDLSAQPVLNYLLAQVFALEGDNGWKAIDGMASLYRRMFDHVLNRCWRLRKKEPRNQSFDALSVDDLRLVLEETATAAWHTGDREIERPALLTHLEKQELSAVFNQAFPERPEGGLNAGLAGVLDSFFCAPGGGRQETYVFTHKSFREYLTARRIVREIKRSAEIPNESARESRKEALGHWINLCGATQIDKDLLDVLRAVLRDHEISMATAADWRKSMANLLQECIDNGPPLADAGTTVREVETNARNTETAVLAAFNACVLRTAYDDDRSVVIFDWSRQPAGLTLNRWLGLASSSIARFCLTQFDLSDADLSRANLSSANLSHANLSRANLSGTDLSNANLSGANLSRTDLSSAILSNTDLSLVNLSGASLSDMNLSGFDLSSVNLSRANLSHTNLSNTNLSDADLSDANLSFANLSNATVSGADLSNANLFGADLFRVDLSRVDLSGVILSAGQKNTALALPYDLSPPAP